MKILFTKLFPTSVLQEKMKVKWCLESKKAKMFRLRRAKKKKHYKNIDLSQISFQRPLFFGNFFGKIDREAAETFFFGNFFGKIGRVAADVFFFAKSPKP